ncbi:hypothetical protein MAMC_01649 [Methylacidimicrobium cyclopophantes]|uniref:Uncharacterized protein n=1 Tax=Methylacidimicrobium cyclopophantes TaxID=1041766 RepID=A0A5E6ME62_9BACT|nr:hypothetical protein [Methylacidimicrobium cyclopophantes]VVM07494.1 hypothetical protein MAMC_01649 [Methylacidimicrobium cyclopophantes]
MTARGSFGARTTSFVGLLPRSAPLGLVLLCSLGWTGKRAAAEGRWVQLVGAQQHYTVFLRESRPARSSWQPAVRCLVSLRLYNWGPDQSFTMSHTEVPRFPTERFRVWRNDQPLRCRKLGQDDYFTVFAASGETLQIVYEYVERVLPANPEARIDVFEDTWGFTGFRPPLEDLQVVVDLGPMYARYRTFPAFGRSSATPAYTYEDFFHRFFRISPPGYRTQGTEVWWNIHNGGVRVTTAARLHVEWRAWYR